MVWIQVWSVPHEYIRAEKIESVYYRTLTKGRSEDWIEILVRPMEKPVLQVCLNIGADPKTGEERKAWHQLAERRAGLVLEEVIRIISDKEHRTKMVSLKDLVDLDFTEEAPTSLDMEIWVWNLPCQTCGKETPVVYPVGAFFGYMLEFNFLSNLPRLLAEKFRFFKKGEGSTKEAGEYHNTCIHCGSAQPDWRVMESYLDLATHPDQVSEKSHITVPLTEAEKAEYKKAGIDPDW
ncbi:MAG: hypothetical protein GYA23_09560 [Methanomicrobiales archaeon]|nr:hypothetical protein [Methanomicrobiales archaeon]